MTRWKWLADQPRLRAAVTGLLILAALAVLGWLVWSQWEALLAFEWHVNGWLLAAAFLLDGLLLVLGAQVFGSMVELFAERQPFLQHLYGFSMNMVARRIPGTIWYVLYRNAHYARLGYSAAATTAASGIEWLTTLTSGLILAGGLGFPVLREFGLPLPLLALVLAAGVLLLSPAVLQRILHWLRLPVAALHTRRVLGWVGLYFLIWLGGGLLFFLVLTAFHPLSSMHLPYVLGSWTITGALSQVLVFLPTNMGFTEISLSVLLSRLIPASVAVVIALLFRLLITVFEMIWAGIFHLIRHRFGQNNQ